jgi:hypothetical protein
MMNGGFGMVETTYRVVEKRASRARDGMVYVIINESMIRKKVANLFQKLYNRPLSQT